MRGISIYEKTCKDQAEFLVIHAKLIFLQVRIQFIKISRNWCHYILMRVGPIATKPSKFFQGICHKALVVKRQYYTILQDPWNSPFENALFSEQTDLTKINSLCDPLDF